MSGPVSTILDPVTGAIDPIVRSTQLFSPRTQNVVVKLIVALLAFMALVGAAVLAYSGFYYFYIPTISHTTPIYLEYSKNALPTARVNFTDMINEHLLSYDQGYDVTVDINLPASDRNFEIGNFMVKVDLLSNEDNVVYSASRPAILRYQSPLLRLISTVVRSAFLVTEWSQEAQQISVKLMEGVTDSFDYPITQAIVTVSDPRLMTYDATIHLEAHFQGLRYLMYYWSVPTGIVFIGTFLLWSLLFAAVAWRSLAQWWNLRSADAYETALGFGEDEGTTVGVGEDATTAAATTELSHGSRSDVFNGDIDDVTSPGRLHGDYRVPDMTSDQTERESRFTDDD